MNIKAPDEPEWFKHLAKDSSITTNDVCSIFGFSQSSFHNLLANGCFPAADFKFHGKLRWKAETILAEIKRRKAIVNNMKKNKNNDHDTNNRPAAG